MDTPTNKSPLTENGKGPAASSANDMNITLRRRYLDLEAQVEAVGDDEATLRRLVHEMDAVATDFIETNNGLAAYVAHRWAKREEDFEELYQQGLVTMWEYFLTWNVDQAAFTTYVMASLEGDIRRLNVKISGSETYYDRLGRGKLVEAVQSLTDRLGRAPSNLEVAAVTGMHVDRVARMRRDRVTSLNDPIDEEGTTRLDLLVDKAYEASDIAADDVERAWITQLAVATEELSIRDLYVLLRRDGLDGWPSETLAQLGSHLGLGREVLRRAETKARESITARGLRLPTPL